MIKRLSLLLVIFCICIITIVNADVGPKPSLEIMVKNAPDSLYYLDLLIDYSDDHLYQFIEEDEIEDKDMYNTLKNYESDGWRPALATGTRVPLHGNLVGVKEGEYTKHYFSYMGVPDRFKIIIVNSEDEIIVSENVLERRSFNTKVYFDCDTRLIKEKSYILSTFMQLLPTCLLTLLIEGIILLLFGFSLKLNWKPFLIINVITQVLLTIIVNISMYIFGIMLAILAFIAFEWVIVVGEAILFSKYLKQHSKKRRVLFAITANIASLFAGLMITLHINLG